MRVSPRVEATHPQIANLETRRVVSAPAVIADRPEFRFGMLGCAVGRQRCRPKTLPIA